MSTPIGNLGDITQRAMETLHKCDAIVCEDTRVTGKLLHLLALRDAAPRHGVRLGAAEPRRKPVPKGTLRSVEPRGAAPQGDVRKKELISFHAFNERGRLEELVNRLKAGQHLALVCDAGTPGISDPGFLLVRAAREARVAVEVVPGPSAFLAALSVSGLPIDRFLYLGFLPPKKGRRTLLQHLREEDRTIVVYESPHRVRKTLSELAEVLGDQPERPIVICRELTKVFEEVVSTTVGGLPDLLLTLRTKGEVVVVLGPRP